MFNKTVLASLITAAVFSSPLWAQAVKGVVTDTAGKPLTGAEISIIGENIRVKSDSDGRFIIDNLHTLDAELHVEASGYAHRNFHFNVPEEGLTDLKLTLLSSAIEVIDVKASPFHASANESALPVSVLAGDNLKMRQAATLGDTLKNEVGVHSSFYGGVTSSPIIRGLDGPRVLITQNGLDSGDASRVGPDHSVAAEASTATQIEVLRGPATLFYGSGAIGGVVNVVDQRVPTDSSTRAEWMLEHGSGNNEKLAAGSISSGGDNFAVYADGFIRDNDAYKIPHRNSHSEADDDHAEHADEALGNKVENTQAKATGFTLGGSYLLDNGFVGVSYGRMDREYGIPGHSHAGHNHAEAEATPDVHAELSQNRWQLLSELNLQHNFIRQINTRFAYTDYQHKEIEGTEIGTVFSNDSYEARVEILHRPRFDWLGGISVHYKYSDFAAVGEEAFTPPSRSEMLALAWMEERHFGPVLLQLGARIEQVTIDASNVVLPSLELHSHDAAPEAGHDETSQIFAFKQKFTPYSLSAGAVWDFAEGYNLGLSLSRSERAPSAAELLAFGPHIGTASYEVGALFNLDADGDSFIVNNQPIKLETANNIDLSLRKFSGDFGFIFNAFYNQIDNYYYQRNTGLLAESGHDHAATTPGSEAAHEHEDELPVYLFSPADVRLHGFEGQFVWRMADPYTLTLQADYIRARLQQGGDLPRTPPLRLAAEFGYDLGDVSADIRATRYLKQDKVAAEESATAGYTLVDASVNYRVYLAGQEISLYVKGQNLTNEYAAVHTSFLKDIAPLPGRSFALGVRGSF
ncbi:TonB-dependent receptor [Rheinheimera salexigens]|uniref:TonB-dependent receptor n=1 Tax=Rheinheimera salexigens TaxID=1628148 RepID=A0A1E7Q3I6_9GAMM|nr:TonB-dependent receptor [Rheinheimera salexigens]OEY68735.1 TonB-dependent receptor [Rheinheimera salexigens]